MKDNFKKKAKVAGSAALAATLLITGSLAWQDVSQHKTNVFATESPSNSVVLVEDFEPVKDWVPGKVYKQIVSVRNGQESDNTDKITFSDGYVRLQIREFMGIGSQETKLSEDRLMIDTDGNFYRFAKKEDANKKVQELGLEGDRLIELKGYSDDAPHFYIKTQAGDINGQYGKFLVVDVQSGDLVSVIDGKTVSNIDENTATEHNNSSNTTNTEDKELFRTRLWIDENGKLKSVQDGITEYVNLEMGQDVITLDQWIKEGSKPVAKWIFDTNADSDGWVYWGDTLRHSKTPTPGSVTSNIVEGSSLTKNVDGRADYRFHVNLDAVSSSEFSTKWANAPKEIISSLMMTGESSVAKEELQKTINTLEEKLASNDILEAKIAEANTLLAEAKQIMNDPASTSQQVVEITNLVKDFVDQSTDYVKLINISLEKVEDNTLLKPVNDSLVTTYMETVQLAKSIINTRNEAQQLKSILEDLETQAKALEGVYANVKDDVYFAGSIARFMGEISDKNAAVLAFQLDSNFKDHLSTIDPDNMYFNLTPGTSAMQALPYKYDESGKQVYQSWSEHGYKGSNLEIVTDSFYDNVISKHEHSKYILPIKVNEQLFVEGQIWKEREDAAIEIGTGDKKMFIPATSDANVYGFNLNDAGTGYSTWTRASNDSVGLGWYNNKGFGGARPDNKANKSIRLTPFAIVEYNK